MTCHARSPDAPAFISRSCNSYSNLGCTVYAIYLPNLAASVGIAPSSVILILMLDQAIFTITDTATGLAADRLAPIVRRHGIFIILLTALSCAAFVALPFVADAGQSVQVWFIVLIVFWAVTSSALRAPPLTLFDRHAACVVAVSVGMTMLGYGLAGAVWPYLAVACRGKSGFVSRAADASAATDRQDADALHRRSFGARCSRETSQC